MGARRSGHAGLGDLGQSREGDKQSKKKTDMIPRRRREKKALKERRRKEEFAPARLSAHA